jgi:anthranilate synthase component 1
MMTGAALRLECRGQEVVVTGLSDAAPALLEAIAERLPQFVQARTEDRLVLHFSKNRSTDLEERLLAPSPFDALRTLVRFNSHSPEERYTLFCGGVIAFDHVDLFEDLPSPKTDPLGFPDYQFWLAETLLVIEPGGQGRIVATLFGSDDQDKVQRSFHAAIERLDRIYARLDAPADPDPDQAMTPMPKSHSTIETDLDDESFAGLVVQLKEHILAGDVYQIVPSRSFQMPCTDPLQAFARQRKLDPSPYMYFVSGLEHRIFGASPETSVKVSRAEGCSLLEVKPIAGTRPRGSSADQDDRMEADLRLDTKEVAEHMMLVDLARNDVARVSLPGTRRVERLLTVERYARVMHLVSSVTGHLGSGYDCLDALQACLNVGTLSGAPKLRATELLREVEPTKRGPYGGAVGWLSGTGEMDTGVIIRSAVIKDGIAYVRAGAGVVHDSDPKAEAAETRAKASAVLSALKGE